MKKFRLVLLSVMFMVCIGIMTGCGNKNNTGTDGSTAGHGTEGIGGAAEEIVTDIGNGIDNVGDILNGSTRAVE